MSLNKILFTKLQHTNKHNVPYQFTKGRFRPATFWKTDRCDLISPAVHRDRTLLTTFRLTDTDDESNWHVLNCHLQAGLNAKRRYSQCNHSYFKKYATHLLLFSWRMIMNCMTLFLLFAPFHNSIMILSISRVLQIEDGVAAAVKLAKKLKGEIFLLLNALHWNYDRFS